jgi:tRNA threonylcarbamoyladenosine biosynthesis protein TsaB
MGRVLAIETATKVCSVALIEDGSLLGEATLNVPQVHVERLVISINDMLTNLHMDYAGLDAVAVSNGPGSFTGLRIGLSVAKGIVFAGDKKLIAVPTLDAIAFKFRHFADSRVVVAVLHARAEEFYYAAYRIEGATLQRLGAYAAADADKITDEFDRKTIFVGEGAGGFAASEAVRKKFGSENFKVIPASASEVALLAEDKFKSGEFSDLRSLAPLYVKDFVAIKGNPLNKLSRQSSGPRQKSGLEKS